MKLHILIYEFIIMGIFMVHEHHELTQNNTFTVDNFIGNINNYIVTI